METTGPNLTPAGLTRIVLNRLGDIGKADVLRVSSQHVTTGPFANGVRVTVETQTWHTANDRDDMLRAIMFMPGYLDHTVEYGTIITVTFR